MNVLPYVIDEAKSSFSWQSLEISLQQMALDLVN